MPASVNTAGFCLSGVCSAKALWVAARHGTAANPCGDIAAFHYSADSTHLIDIL